jgi:steroid 5-alpha reductase family enzyme
MPPPLLLPVVALAPLSLVMAALWARQRRTQDAGWVDAAWTASLGALPALYALAVDGVVWRRVFVAALAGVWAARLLSHLVPRLARGPEDGRYRALRERWGPRTDRLMLGFFLAQALVAALLSYAHLLAMSAPAESLRAIDVAALALFTAGVVGEAVADRQLARWIADPAHRGRTCRAGLWRFSRHPNYFFEWIHWSCWPLLAWGGAHAGWAALAPLVMLLLLLFVSGIPPSEAQALRSRGADYRRYQRATSAFVPWPPRAEEPA